MDGDDGLLLNLSSSGDGQQESGQANKNKKLKWRERKLQKRNNRLALRARRDERNSMTTKPLHNQRKESRKESRTESRKESHEESREESRKESRKESRTGAPPVEPEEGALRKEYGLSSAQKSTHVTKQPRKKAQVISSLFNYNPEIPALTKVSGELPNQKEETEEKLFSGDKFSELDLSPFMLSNLEENLKFTSMTSVQRAAIPPLLSGRDVFVKSKTGTGKTLTYAVPVVQSLQKLEPKITRGDGPYAVVLVPTRELAQQSFDVLLKLVKPFQWVVPGIVTGGEKRKSEKARIRKGINILVATPGRLLDHIEKTKSLELKRMRWIILDEADRLFDLGFEKDVSSILTAIQKSLTTGMRCQTALLSATLSEGVERLAGVSLNKPLFIDVTDNEGAAKTTESPQAAADTSYKTPQELQQYFIIVPNKLRLVTLAVFLLWKNRTEDSTAAKMIVFLSSRDSVDFHCDLLKETLPSRSKFQLTLFKLHGNMSQTERTDVFKRFTEAKCGILFCTDVAARGLDLPHVNWIIQYNTPGNPADYVHRVGRTARIGSKGQALLFLTPAEVEYLETLKQHGIGSPKELFVNEVLRTLVDFPKDASTKKHKNLLDQRAQGEATNLQNSFEDYVLSEPRHLEAAKTAYQSFVRAYATYPSSLKHIFHIKNLHLGHVAKSFALRDAPAEMFQPTKQHKTGKRKREDHKNQNKTKVKRVTEYSSDTGLNGPLPKQKKKGVAAKKRKKTSNVQC